MYGLYVHIPFCPKRCAYCDFFSTTQTDKQDDYVEALCQEIELRKNYLPSNRLQTVYLGGGTPSQLSADNLVKIFDAIQQHFILAKDAEITIEANSEDINEDFLTAIERTPINRLSIGVQSLCNKELNTLGRRHTAEKAIESVQLAHRIGIHNISIDLMYALPGQDMVSWEQTLNKALELPVTHISAYHLTYEEGTPLYRLKHLAKGEDESLAMYSLLLEKTKERGFVQYEISNFAKEGYHSRHNSSYWQSIPYLGIGAAAHSYNGSSRCWNMASLEQYIALINAGKEAFEEEILSNDDIYNELLITRLRTLKGLDIEEIDSCYLAHFNRQIASFVTKGDVIIHNNWVQLSPTGILISDYIIRELMV